MQQSLHKRPAEFKEVRRVRSTQFDDHSRLEEQPEQHRRRIQPNTLCEPIRRLGYAQNTQSRKSSRVRRVRIPLTIAQRAKEGRHVS